MQENSPSNFDALKKTILSLLKRKILHSDELRFLLLQQGFEKMSIENALSYCKDLYLIDDKAWETAFLERKKRSLFGPQRVANELKMRGISCKASYSLKEECGILKKFLEKWKKTHPIEKSRSLQAWKASLYRALYQRGFSKDAIDIFLSE